jgi:hypothetical protein
MRTWDRFLKLAFVEISTNFNEALYKEINEPCRDFYILVQWVSLPNTWWGLAPLAGQGPRHQPPSWPQQHAPRLEGVYAHLIGLAPSNLLVDESQQPGGWAQLRSLKQQA